MVSPKTSRRMAAIDGTDNKAEVMLRKALLHRGFRYRLYHRRLPGEPDIVFSKYRGAVFVDGDAWHGRLLREGGSEMLAASFAAAKRQWWTQKITTNVERDLHMTDELKALGSTVVRVWESESKSDLTR